MNKLNREKVRYHIDEIIKALPQRWANKIGWNLADIAQIVQAPCSNNLNDEYLHARARVGALSDAAKASQRVVFVGTWKSTGDGYITSSLRDMVEYANLHDQDGGWISEKMILEDLKTFEGMSNRAFFNGANGDTFVITTWLLEHYAFPD